jgi:predicted metal-binding transcription factor (methanogenesis marker protein 9)
MNPNARHIVVKTLLSPDEYLELSRKCAEADLTHSKALRDLVRSWTPRRHVMQDRRPVERPASVQSRAMFPARRGGAPLPLRV